MRILLIEPPKSPVTIGGEDLHLFEPLALEYLAAVPGQGPGKAKLIADSRPAPPAHSARPPAPSAKSEGGIAGAWSTAFGA